MARVMVLPASISSLLLGVRINGVVPSLPFPISEIHGRNITQGRKHLGTMRALWEFRGSDVSLTTATLIGLKVAPLVIDLNGFFKGRITTPSTVGVILGKLSQKSRR